MINFNVPPYVGRELEYMGQAVRDRKISGDGEYTRSCSCWLEEHVGVKRALLTTSCTHALEMSALLCEIQPGDEVIMPSYTFVSTANAFTLRGAKIVFVDIRPDTMNIDEKLIENAVTAQTKAIVPVHYAGVGCEMDRIMEIAQKYHLYVVEDAAQGLRAFYKDRPLGGIGDFGCFSFHETKNISMGEGGAVLISHDKYVERAEIIREKGTNRVKFFRGEIDKYTWVDIGSSYLPSELNAAYLMAQLECADKITSDRLASWDRYRENLSHLGESGEVELPRIPAECRHNGHMFYIKTADKKERTALQEYLRKKDIMTVFHYVPLHTSEAGRKFGFFAGEDTYTTRESERLLRLPLYYGMEQEKVDYICEQIERFYHGR